MEFFPGAFEREWERRRAMLMYEMQLGQSDRQDWEEPRRGGVARIGDEGLGGFGRARRQGGSAARRSRGGAGAAGRSMRTRFGALARGSQPAVVKLASYGGGARAGAMMSYTSRGGELAVENERGERVLGRDALAEQRAEWEHLFDNRAASRDMAVFHVSVDAASLRDHADQDDQLRDILRAGFGDRRFVYASRERPDGDLYVSGVVVLRDRAGERLTGDRKAAEIVQQRLDDSDAGRDVEAHFRFHGYGNGVEWGTARVRELVAGAEEEVRDDTGRLIGDATQAGDLVQKEWRKELHSRKGRDVMHLIVSARAGTDEAAFEAAVREFLGEQFAGHRYAFAVHDPALDPKEVAEGGKRPHIHAHAIVTMRSETGERIVTSPQMFREWRSVMAEKAREQGIDMELTDRREFASAPAYTRNQVRPVSYRGRTEHEGTSSAAHSRYRAKRSNEIQLASTDRSRQYAATAVEAWSDLANEAGGSGEGAFATRQSHRLERASENTQNERVFVDSAKEPVKNITNMIELTEFVNGEDGQMREMTRPEFEAYETRVEAVLSSVEQTLDDMDRADFDEIAAAAREVVDIRREYLELTERQVDREGGQEPRGSRDDRFEDANAQWNAAVARFGLEAVETANDVLVQVNHYREGLDRIEAGELPDSFTASYRAGLEREINGAAEMAVDGDNQYMREAAKSDQELQRVIHQIELSRAEQAPSDRSQDGNQEAPSFDAGANRRTDGAPGGFQGSAEAEQHRDPGREGRSTREHDDQIIEQRAVMPPEQRTLHPDVRSAERKPALDSDLARSDPPQQHVPRLRQIELDLEERQDRDRDDRER
ncbi:relaxase/mobilization nuclease domain-containing protein [Mesorhizobium australicum]|uniref:Relaxase/Mobilisation nuclease domain-containing protein n=1 Tax=Mesorhizobium australicum TaxID=536018 RepID=A0A1X7MQC6_9HYPH|nr:relaxase/mobilization nuclease domain-containing protein [Mesorhizobium australicum]SMH26551.1 Relaxase/Mobilisation nuclease domain-containing protein [Mesorhizobium australicum]